MPFILPQVIFTISQGTKNLNAIKLSIASHLKPHSPVTIKALFDTVLLQCSALKNEDHDFAAPKHPRVENKTVLSLGG